MHTVEKALKLLNLFTVAVPEWGLSDIARAAGLDKATALRMLTSLTRHGLLEQQQDNRRYRLGPTVLKLARVREASFPVASLLQPIVDDLSRVTGETAHASLVAAGHITTIAVAEPQRATRVHVDPSEPVPLHATASGIVCLAYGSAIARDSILASLRLVAFTRNTLTSRESLVAELDQTRRRGFAIARGTFEEEVVGIAAPYFDGTGVARGAVAAASIGSRMTQESECSVARAVVMAGIEATCTMGGELPASFPSPDEIARP